MRLIAVLFALLLSGITASPAVAQNGDVTIELDTLGVGNAMRPGDMAALRLRISTVRTEPIPAWIQWEVPNADGDIGEYGRQLTINSGSPQLVWLYAPLSPRSDQGTIWTIGVYAYEDGERGQRIGETLIRPPAASTVVPIESEMIAVVGQQRGNLNQLSLRRQQGDLPVATMEESLIIPGIMPTDCPDRWWGWLPYHAVYWGDAANAPPGELAEAQETALADWVARGGHLIINLPSGGNPWGLGTLSNAFTRDLQRILPTYELERRGVRGAVPRVLEDVRLDTVLPQLAKLGYEQRIEEQLHAPLSMRIFRSGDGTFDIIDNHYRPLLATDDGDVFVIQRRHGTGHVTVIGLDLSQPTIADFGLPQGDVFWNRILGRRADTPTSAEYNAIEQAALAQGGLTRNQAELGRGDVILSAINQSQQAGVGLLLALVLFIVYWLVAGPVAYMALKTYNLAHHSWLAFALASIVFTGIAWGAVSIIPNRRMSIRHLTILDHVAQPAWDQRDVDVEPQMQNAVSFISVYNPGYNDTALRILSGEARQHDLLVPFTPVRSLIQAFPNAARFRVDCATARNEPTELILPSRATSTLVEANWRGNVDPEWGRLIAESQDDPVRVEPRYDPATRTYAETLRGTLVHGLPGTLEDVKIYWIENRPLGRAAYMRDDQTFLPWRRQLDSGRLLLNGTAQAFPPWPAGEPLPLVMGDDGGSLRMTMDRLVDDVSELANPLSTNRTISDRQGSLEVLSFFHQVRPPEYLKSSSDELDSERRLWLRRVDGRELDMSIWFNRPCLIVIGYLRDVEIPIPLRINGSDVPPYGTGDVMIRWMMPLRSVDASTADPPDDDATDNASTE